MIILRPESSARRRPRLLDSLARSRASKLLAAAVLGLLAAGFATAAPAQAQPDQIEQTEWGPLNEADKELLTRVKQLGLWAIPAGALAAERGADERVQEVGGIIEEEYPELDQLAEETAAQLGMDLPDEPSAEQQEYYNRIENSADEQFDVEFVTLLRESYGKVFPLIAYTRGGTQNALIRELVIVSVDAFEAHMGALESTGAVDWNQISEPPSPAGRPTRFLASGPAGINPVYIWIVLGAAVVAGTITVVRTVRPR